jgi:hypothetical protein
LRRAWRVPDPAMLCWILEIFGTPPPILECGGGSHAHRDRVREPVRQYASGR